LRELTAGTVRRSLRRFQDFANDLCLSDMNTFEDRVKLLVDYCQSDAVCSVLHQQLVRASSIEFEDWYSGVLSSKGGMAGSGKLTFPTDLDNRLSLMYQLLLRVAKGEVGVVGFAHDFFATGDNRIDSYIQAFSDAVVEPLTRELAYRIEELEEGLPEDDREACGLASIQIIHKAENVIQQSASGSRISQTINVVSQPELDTLFAELREELRLRVADEAALEDALQKVEASEQLVREGGKRSLPSLRALLGSLGALGNVGSIVSGILQIVAATG